VILFAVAACWHVDRPGYLYDEVLFVNAALGGVDESFVHARVLGVPVMLMSYLGALKAWLHAPVFAVFGVSAETIRVPSVLLAAASLYLFARIGDRLFGQMLGFWFLLVLATDPRLFLAARVDYGPVVLMMLLKAAALLLFLGWLAEPSTGKLAALLAVLALGVFDKLNFIWFVVALGAAAIVVHSRQVTRNLRQSGASGMLLLVVAGGIAAWVGATCVLPLLGSDLAYLPKQPPVLSLQRLFALLEIVRSTLLAARGWYLLFPGPPPVGTAFTLDLALAQSTWVVGLGALALAAMTAWAARRGQARTIAFLFVLLLVLFVQVLLTRQATMPHHAFVLHPFHLLLVFAIAAPLVQALLVRRRALAHALVGVAAGLLVVAHVRADAAYLERIEDPAGYLAESSPAIRDLSDRIRSLRTDAVFSVDWGLHTQLFSLAAAEDRARFTDLWATFENPAASTVAGKQSLRERFAGRRIVVVQHTSRQTVMRGARNAFLDFRAEMLPGAAPPERVADAAGRRLYEIHLVPAEPASRSGS